MDIKVIRWPSEARKRERCKEAGQPRLLLVEGSVAAPLCIDSLEDWVRAPVANEDLRARIVALRMRTAWAGTPVIDGDDVLRLGDRRLPLSPLEARLMRALTEQYRSVVCREELVRRGWADGYYPGRRALDLHILRMRRRICPLNLSVRTVWGRGYLLEPSESVHDGSPA